MSALKVATNPTRVARRGPVPKPNPTRFHISSMHRGRDVVDEEGRCGRAVFKATVTDSPLADLVKATDASVDFAATILQVVIASPRRCRVLDCAQIGPNVSPLPGVTWSGSDA